MARKVQGKPRVYLLVILPILFFGELALMIALIWMYAQFRNVPRDAIPNLNGFFIFLPAVFLWMPVSLLLGNVIPYIVPPLRRIAERYSSETDRPGYLESQKGLLKVLGIFAMICIPLIVLGFIL